MSTETLERAYANARNVLTNVKADQLDDATPCASWDVRQVINHLVGGTYFFAVSVEAGATPEGDTSEGTDYAGGDFVAAFDEGAAAALAAFRAPGALEKPVKLAFGEFAGAACMGLATTDSFQHAWDLAKATGQDTNLDPELAAQLLEGARASIPDQFRGPDGQAPFGAQVDIDDSAPAADQLAAFLGRSA